MKNCKHMGCKRRAAKNRNECNTCRTKIQRSKNPIRTAFTNLRNNAKRRGIQFDLSFSQFEKFYVATDYIKGKGITKQAYTIDRIDSQKGYTTDNIQVLTNENNIIKMHLDIHFYNKRPSFRVRKVFKRIEQCPFASIGERETIQTTGFGK